jgi:DNA-binding NtrC family response regulator
LQSEGRVLLVDDEESLLRVLARYVRSLGFTVTTVADGASAVELVRRGDLDVVVSDIGMPEMDGIALLRAVRAHDLDLPVILMTAAPAVETAVHAVEYGALRYLTKPVELDALGAAIQYAVRVRRLAGLKRAAVAHLGTDGELAGDRAGSRRASRSPSTGSGWPTSRSWRAARAGSSRTRRSCGRWR